MKFEKNKSFSDYIGDHTLLYGETNTKKTYYTAKFVQFLVESNFNPKEISILDFAPKMITINDLKIGGRVIDFYEESIKCNYLAYKGEIIPPRLNANNSEELDSNARNNHEITSKLLDEYNLRATPILIINDISIYLHVGNLTRLCETIKKANTFFGNTYYGIKINKTFSSKFSMKEKELVESLVKMIKNSYITSST